MSRMSTLLATMAAAAAAVLASTGASAAEVKGAAYADLRFGLDHFDAKGSSLTPPAYRHESDFANHGTYWGLKGSTSKDGLTAFGAYERWLDVDQQNTPPGVDLQRQAYAGLATPYGTAQFGTFATAYMEAGRKLDPFYDTGAAGIGNPAFAVGGIGQGHGQSRLASDTNPGLSGLAGGFVADQLAYTSPTLFGFTGNVAVMFDEKVPSGSARRDDYAAGVEWTGMGILAGVQHLAGNSSINNTGLDPTPAEKRTNATRLYGGYSQQRFGANVSAERINHKGGAHNSDYLQVNGWFGVLPTTRVAGSFGMENESGAEGSSFRVGVFHDVLDNFTLNVVYRNYHAKPEGGATTPINPSDQVVSLGASYRFELGASTTTH